ncbi:MAG: GTP-binding protein [Verrucomicrobiales bacterium]|nr:GTP-binding protein [Verrucomicrobiales bacterium]
MNTPVFSAPENGHRENSKPNKQILSLGLESVGKTQLLSRLSGRFATPENFRGSTLACNSYTDNDISWVDSPGIYRDSETETASATREALSKSVQVMLVVRADRALDQLQLLLPMVEGKAGFIVVTFSDRINQQLQGSKLQRDLSDTSGVPVFLVDARNFGEEARDEIRKAVTGDSFFRFQQSELALLVADYPSSEKRISKAERIVNHPLVAVSLLLSPTIIAVTQANRFADWLYAPVTAIISPLQSWIESGPPFLALLFSGDYGLVSMFPFLILYALPTIIIFSAILAIYKSTGLIDRLSVALHPYLRPFGIGGRDLVRVIMGFGCNVPAVIASRSCASCSRGTCVSAISFGSACSYQLPATLAVFAAADMSELSVVYIVVLAVTTLIYLRFNTPKVLRLANNQLLLPESDPLHKPSIRGISREVVESIHQFVIMALPIFAAICFVAATLAYFGILDALGRVLQPLMALFSLPGEAATAIALGSIRKDGIAIGLLDDDWGALKVGLENPAQVLTAVYLAGVLLPCLVTLYTIGKEMRWTFAAKLCLRQMAWASGFALAIAWIGGIFF